MTDTIQRYDPDIYSQGYMVKDNYGEFVTFEDHTEVVNQLIKERDLLSADLERYKNNTEVVKSRNRRGARKHKPQNPYKTYAY